MQLHADESTEALHESETMTRVQDEGDLQQQRPVVDAGRGRANGRCGLADEIVVQPFLDFPVQEGVVRSERLELRVPQGAGFIDVPRVQPQARAGGTDCAPCRVRRGRHLRGP